MLDFRDDVVYRLLKGEAANFWIFVDFRSILDYKITNIDF